MEKGKSSTKSKPSYSHQVTGKTSYLINSLPDVYASLWDSFSSNVSDHTLWIYIAGPRFKYPSSEFWLRSHLTTFIVTVLVLLPPVIEW